MKEDKVFLDTNILVYAHDISAREKHKIALEIMENLWDSGLGILSTQVLQEFFPIATKKIPYPLSIRSAKEVISVLLTWDVVVNDSKNILEAIDIYEQHKYSFWDSLIIQAAIKGNASLLLTEDFKDGQAIEGLKIENPFIY
jgi:predicted nucleic acid-binding protein